MLLASMIKTPLRDMLKLYSPKRISRYTILLVHKAFMRVRCRYTFLLNTVVNWSTHWNVSRSLKDDSIKAFFTTPPVSLRMSRPFLKIDQNSTSSKKDDEKKLINSLRGKLNWNEKEKGSQLFLCVPLITAVRMWSSLVEIFPNTSTPTKYMNMSADEESCTWMCWLTTARAERETKKKVNVTKRTGRRHWINFII